LIQAKGLPFNDQDEIALGYKTTTMDGNYTIDIDEVDGVLKGQNIYFDKLNNLTHNLKRLHIIFLLKKGTYTRPFCVALYQW
jgi:hypothetical protein